jgi:hypothetical protein
MDYSKMKYQSLEREEEKLHEKYKAIEEECLKERKSFSEFQKEAHSVAESLYFIGKYKRKLQDPIVEYGKEWKGTLMEMEDFKNLALSDSITDEDGYGFYATISSKSNVVIMPSDVKENILRDDFSHVMWFER